MAHDSASYWSRAWGLLTRDKGWAKVLLVMGVAGFVPIVGMLGTSGYGLEWARLTAWGVDSAPKQKDVRVGECISSGWRGFVSALGLVCLWAALRMLFAQSFVEHPFGLILLVLDLAVGVICSLCALRAAIYQDFKAGYQVNRIIDMIRRDPVGLGRIILAVFLMDVVIWFVVAFFAVIMAVAFAFSALSVFGATEGVDVPLDVMLRYQTFSGLFFPTIIVMVYLVLVAYSFVNLMEYNMLALWLRQFDVPSWGSSSDPLPDVPVPPAVPVVSPAVPGDLAIEPTASTDAPSPEGVSGTGACALASAASSDFMPGDEASPVPGDSSSTPAPAAGVTSELEVSGSSVSDDKDGREGSEEDAGVEVIDLSSPSPRGDATQDGVAGIRLQGDEVEPGE
ncbi:hypothetical protein HMPREF1008_00480 [Olsenella sp. oral taxon 809 str. F0356]|uniref:DUF4013 domain-containing protein n=1 Tax=Olsenella sp. oral taxon 809 TaxID=661086 RepID=UPI000231F001|nr:DUF4013 domain-containing protein [Olsenella sp. oral taxon 809]EHF02835.1 hypothetical protein HMPREF1008_00480 [Olsenella sp. oral taxon 809 str. F0356]